MEKGLFWEWNRLFRTDWSSWTVLTNNVKHIGFHIHCKQYLSLSRFSGKLHARTSAAFPVLCLQSRVWSFHCLVPRRLSFDENVRAKKGGKETTGNACRLYPSHGPLRFITSHSFRARLCHAKNEAPEEEAGPFMSPCFAWRTKKNERLLVVWVPHCRRGYSRNVVRFIFLLLKLKLKIKICVC